MTTKIKCEVIPHNDIYQRCHYNWSSVDLIMDEDRSHSCADYQGHDWIHECSCGAVEVVLLND